MDWKRLIDGLEKVARIVGVTVAGSWVYFNASRGRTFVPRLQLELSGRLFSERGKKYLLVTIQVKNVGSSIVKITQEGTCIKMNPLRSDVESSEIKSLERENTNLFPVLRRYLVSVGKPKPIVDNVDEVEPGAAINEQQLFLMPADLARDFELELRVAAIRGAWWIPAKLVPRD